MTTCTSNPPKLGRITKIGIKSIDSSSLDKILKCAVEAGLRDIYINSNDYITGKRYNEYVEISDRPITHSEAESLLKTMAPVESYNRIFSGLSSNGAYEVRSRTNLKDTNNFRYSITKCTTGSQYEVDAAIRPIPTDIPTIEFVGIGDEVMEHIRKIKMGLILVIGATGEGKSATLAAIIRNVLERESHKRILEYSRPIETRYNRIQIHPSNRIRQHEVSEMGAGGDMCSYLEACSTSMRKAADWFNIGEMTEPDSFSAALNLCNTGHLVSSTLHANSIKTAFGRVEDMFEPSERRSVFAKLINESQILMAQRLLTRKGSGLVAIRETLICTPTVKKQLREAEDAREMTTIAQSILAAQGNDFESQAKAACLSGKITERTLTDFMVNI